MLWDRLSERVLYHEFSMRASVTYSSIDSCLDHEQPHPAYDTFSTPTLNFHRQASLVLGWRSLRLVGTTMCKLNYPPEMVLRSFR